MTNLMVTRSTMNDFIVILPAIIMAWLLIDICREILYSTSKYMNFDKGSPMDMIYIGCIIFIVLIIYLWWTDKSKDVENIGDIAIGIPGI